MITILKAQRNNFNFSKYQQYWQIQRIANEIKSISTGHSGWVWL